MPVLFSGMASTSIPDFATVVLAGATVVLAYFTYMLYQETKKMRLAQIQPEIALYISPQKQWINLVDLIIKNIGPGTAYNIRFSVSPEFLVGHRDSKSRLADLPIIRNGIGYMGPSQEYAFFLFFILDYKGQPQPILDVSVFYESVFGTEYKKDFHFDFSFLIGLGTENDYTHEISESLKEIERNIANISEKFR